MSMSRRAKRPAGKQTLQPAEHPPLGAPGGLQESGIKLGGIAMRALTYRELEVSAPPQINAPRMSLNIELTGGISARTQPDGTRSIELTLEVLVQPDPAVKPIEVRAIMSALFAGNRPLDVIARFVNASGARIVFPYLRELVSAATARGIYGPVFIDPITVGALVEEDELRRMLVEFAAADVSPG